VPVEDAGVVAEGTLTVPAGGRVDVGDRHLLRQAQLGGPEARDPPVERDLQVALGRRRRLVAPARVGPAGLEIAHEQATVLHVDPVDETADPVPDQGHAEVVVEHP